PDNATLSHTDTRIVIQEPHLGSVYVQCQGVATTLFVLSDLTPFVFATVPTLGDTAFPVLGSSTQLQIWGLYFGDNSPPTIKIGSTVCQVLSYTTFPCASAPLPPAAQSFTPPQGATCDQVILQSVPPGIGAQQPLLIINGNMTSVPADPR